MGRKPVRVKVNESKFLNQALLAHGIAVPTGITLYVTDTKCGRHNKKQQNITVPLWAVLRSHAARNSKAKAHDPEYQIYYACHEIAHAMTPDSRVHGTMHSPEFYKALISICPAHLLHYELGYKPRLAAAAGIKSK